jgi:hypothetical protein
MQKLAIPISIPISWLSSWLDIFLLTPSQTMQTKKPVGSFTIVTVFILPKIEFLSLKKLMFPILGSLIVLLVTDADLKIIDLLFTKITLSDFSELKLIGLLQPNVDHSKENGENLAIVGVNPDPLTINKL